MSDPNAEKSQRVTQAMLQMTKLGVDFKNALKPRLNPLAFFPLITIIIVTII